jgi:predicted metal-dependent phosphoesterase TrpH
MRYDMHIHTYHSHCSSLKPEVILKLAKKRGLQGVGMVDHNTCKGALMVKKLNKDKDFEVVPGQEVSTDKGHVLAYYTTEDIKERELYDVLDKIHDLGGIAVVAHPFRLMPTLGFKHPLWKLYKHIDGVEVLNGRNMLHNVNKRTFHTAQELGMGIVGGSDAHFPIEIGNCMTLFKDDFRKSLKKHLTRVDHRRGYTIKGIIGSFMSVGQQVKSRL